MDSAQQQGPDDAVTLGVGPLRLPEYLNRSQIVTRGGGSELEIDEFSRWAEPLTQALHRVVSTDVDNMMSGVRVIAFPWEAAIQGDVDYRLLGEVTRFDADRSGRVVLDIQWAISDIPGQVTVVIRRSKYETQVARSDDPAIVASAMNDALAMFSRDV
ncbi:MAG: PqiC family protein, partial [Pirellulaceae bacterium]